MKKAKVALVSMLMLASCGLYAQTDGIGGKVTDHNGEPIIGATIKVKGSNVGAVTNIDGDFTINAKPGETLVISYIGYENKEVAAGSALNIVLDDSSETLNEVVVTGYQVQRKADLTGSVSVVSTKDLKSSSDTDPMRSLQGKVPGMTISTDGSPIGTGTVRIRGIGSFNSSQDPLFVIDGVPTTTTLGTNDDVRWTWSNTANYNFDIATDHHFTVLAGMELHKQTKEESSAYAQSFDLEDKDYMWPDAATGIRRSSGIGSGYTLASFFGKVDYNWQDLLLASFTIRRDGSSRFGKNNRYGSFPAATLGYRLSKNLKANWLDDLKIRASWGKTGNQEIANNARYGLYVADYGQDRVTSTAYDLYRQGTGVFPSGFRATQTANENLKWETTIQYNVGVDFSMFNQALYGTVDGYIKDVKDMLISPAFLGAMGEGGNMWSNGPSLRNIGMEASVGYRHTTSYGLRYDVNANVDFFRNHVTYLPSTTTGAYEHTMKQNLVEAKKPYGSMVGYVVDGLFQTKEEAAASGQPNARVGGLKYADLDNNGSIDANDQTWIYNPVPDFNWGLNVQLSYKNFDLSMFFQGVCGVDVYNNQKFQTDFWSLTDSGSNKGNRLLGAWTQDNTSSTIPALTTNNTGDEGRRSSYFVEHGSWMKLRTLQIGYNFEQSLLKKLHMTSACVYVSGQNIFTLKSNSFTISDPENPNWAYPHSSSVSLGLQLSF